MKHQQVSVDYWAMGKSMITYGVLTALVWVMLRLISAVFTLPRRLRAQQDSMEATIKELQKRYPDLNITAEDLQEAEKEFEEYMKSSEEAKNAEKLELSEKCEIKEITDEPETVEDKKSI